MAMEGGSDSSRKRQREEEQAPCSEAMEASIQQIQQKMEQFTQMVSTLLETGKSFFTDVVNAFEETVLQLHQKQIEKWSEEIQMLRDADAINEDMHARLHNAQSLILFHPGLTSSDK